MSTKKEEILYRGSVWRKCDLQVHTYMDPKWSWPSNYPAGKDKENERRDKFNGDLIRHCSSNEISIIAITDHNTAEAIDDLLTKNKSLNYPVTILPGVEVISSEGIHILVIFDPNPKIDLKRWNTWREAIDNFLTDIGVQKPRFENEAQRNVPDTANETVENIIKKSIEYSAIVILPHTNSANGGIFKKGDSRTRKRILKRCRILDLACELAVLADRIKDIVKELENHGLKPSDYAVINTSDSRKIQDVGSKFIWIKADPTFEGLKQIIYEPQLRVCINDRAPLYLYPQIVSFQLEGIVDYQDKKSIELFPPINLKKQIVFSSNLTTIIGPRASGKTALVELLSYIFNKHSMDPKNKKPPLIPFLAEKFPNIIVKISYQQGEKESEVVKREVVNLTDPFYTSPLNIEYWPQGEIEKVADSKEKIAEYIEERLESSLLLSISLEINKLEKELEAQRNKYINKIEAEIEQKKLLAEKEQIEGYFEKLKTQEYKDLVRKIRDNRTTTQLLDSFIESLMTTIEFLEESKKQINFTNVPDKKKILELFSGHSSLLLKIDEFYKFTEVDFVNTITRFKDLKELIEKSKEKKELEEERLKLKNDLLGYCKKNGINITQTEYEKRTNRLTIINQRLRELETKLNEYEAAKQLHIQFAQKLKDKLEEWRRENNRIIKDFNKTFSNSDIQVFWEDPSERLLEWVTNKFLASDLATKQLIKKHYYISSPAREDFVCEIIKELIVDKKYPIDKIIDYLKNKKIPPLSESGGKEENLKWFFQRDETGILREDLIMRLQEYGEKGVNLIQYKKKILGKHTMSFGERCGTLIELILYSGDHPLIIDQPEEHLDAKFVADRVVDIIREQKINRQIIICTHNANVVVLGDSELVTVLSVDDQGTDSCQGSLENLDIRKQIYDVLEGGPDAFRKREQKYGIVK